MKIERQTLAQQVLDRLIIRLAESNHQPGDKLATEQELMEEFMVSRSSVREAIKALQNLGILESKPARGTFISTQKDTYARLLIFASLLSEDSRGDLIEFQFALESKALCTLCQRVKSLGDADAQDALAQSIDALSRVVTTSKRGSNSTEVLEANHRAHSHVIGQMDDSLQATICSSLLDFLRQKIWTELQSAQLKELSRSYLDVLRSLQAGDEENFFQQLDAYYQACRQAAKQLQQSALERARA